MGFDTCDGHRDRPPGQRPAAGGRPQHVQTILEDDPTVTVAVLVNDIDADGDTLAWCRGRSPAPPRGRRRRDRPGRRKSLHAGAGPDGQDKVTYDVSD